MKKLLIAGASGYLGSRVAREAAARGYSVRVLVRRREQAEMLHLPDAEVFVGNATQPESLTGIMDGIDTVCSTLGITRQKDGLSYEDVDYGANATLLRIAESAGIDRFAYVGVFRGTAISTSRLVAAKERFIRELEKSALQSTVIRPTGFFSDMGDFLAMARRGKVYLFGDGETKLNPISGKDLAAAILGALEKGEEELNIGGPRTYSQNQLAREAFSALGRTPRIIHVPDWIRRALLRLLPFISPLSFYGPLQFFLSAMAIDMEAPKYGSQTLEEFFAMQADPVQSIN